MRRKKGVDLGSELDRLAKGLNRRGGGGLVQARVMDAWAEVAGHSVLAHTTGAHLREGELVIHVDSPVWATELSALSENYRGAVNEKLGKEMVRAVRFSVSRKVAQQRAESQRESEAEASYREDDVPSVPLTDNERAQIEASVSGIGDSELREAVLRATVADLEWKKGIKAAKSREAAREGP
jgi:hypothetical protein